MKGGIFISVKDFDKKQQKIYFGRDITTTVNIELNAKDIEAWLEYCVEPEILDWLARRAKQLANELRNNDCDDFRSRA